MTDRERAVEYISIFAMVGDRWRGYVPVDSEPTATGVRIGTVEVGPGDDGRWFLTEGGATTWYRKAVPA